MTIGRTTELTLSAWSTAPVGQLGVKLAGIGGAFVPSLVDPRTHATVELGYGVAVTLPDAPVMTNGASGHLSVTVPASARPGSYAALIIDARSSYDVFTDWPFVVQAVAP